MYGVNNYFSVTDPTLRTYKFKDHPRIRFPSKYQGRPSTTSAAGAYQFEKATWDSIKQQLKLPDFSPHTHFTAEVYILGKDEGGRHTPFFNNYRPQFYFRTTDVTGSIELPKDKEMVMPGDNVTITVKLIAPIAMEEGLRFAIREGGRTVGAGVVAKILA